MLLNQAPNVTQRILSSLVDTLLFCWSHLLIYFFTFVERGRGRDGGYERHKTGAAVQLWRRWMWYFDAWRSTEWWRKSQKTFKVVSCASALRISCVLFIWKLEKQLNSCKSIRYRCSSRICVKKVKLFLVNVWSRNKDDKMCGVCGDKALGCNFDAISCESCKAFFRRNALKSKVCFFN